MVDYTDPRWNESDSQNTSPAPNGLPPNSAPNAVYSVIRGGMGAQKRQFDRENARGLCTNSGNAYALTYDVPPDNYYKGSFFSFFVSAANTGPATLNINGMPTKDLVQNNGTPLKAGDLVADAPITVTYDGTKFRMLTASAKPEFAGLTVNGKTVFTVDNDGAGSLLDADKLDGQEGAWYLDRTNHTGGFTTQPQTDNSTAAATTAFVQTMVGSNGRRALTVSASTPSGGADGDVWYQI